MSSLAQLLYYSMGLCLHLLNPCEYSNLHREWPCWLVSNDDDNNTRLTAVFLDNPGFYWS